MGIRAWVRWMAGALVVVWVTLGTGQVKADRLADVVDDLTPYPTTDDAHFFQALSVLAEVERTGETPTQRNAARFLRTMAGVDMWLISHFREERENEARVAASLGLPEARLPEELVRTLSLFRDSAYAGATEDARRAVLRASAGIQPDEPAGGVRESLVLLLQAGVALDEPEALSALSHMGFDPCAAGHGCAERFAHLGAMGRRAAQLLENAFQAYGILERARHADPLLEQLSGLIDASYLRVLSAQLSPDVRLTEGVQCVGEGCALHGALDILVLVEPGRVRVARAPQLRLDDQGRIRNVGDSASAWPETREVALPKSYPGYIKHIDRVVEAIESLGAGPGELRVAVGASDEVPSHEWARVVLSARRAGADAPLLLARSGNGDSRVAPLRVVTAFGAPKLAPSDVDVFVLASGHSVRLRGQPPTTIERLQATDGHARWNLEALAERAAPGRANSAQLRFLPHLPAGTVLGSAFAMAPNERPLTVVLP